MSRSLPFLALLAGLTGGLTAGCGAEPKPAVKAPPTSSPEATEGTATGAPSALAPVSGVAVDMRAPAQGASSAPEAATPPSAVGSGPSAFVVGAAPAAQLPAPEPVSVAVGATFDLSLPANPTTGYQWKVGEPLPDHLELVSNTFESANAQAAGGPPKPGTGGTSRFTFKARKAGKGLLSITYGRPWESPAQGMLRTWDVEAK